MILTSPLKYASAGFNCSCSIVLSLIIALPLFFKDCKLQMNKGKVHDFQGNKGKKIIKNGWLLILISKVPGTIIWENTVIVFSLANLPIVVRLSKDENLTTRHFLFPLLPLSFLVSLLLLPFVFFLLFVLFLSLRGSGDGENDARGFGETRSFGARRSTYLRSGEENELGN